jgi:threonine dehydrogenase-like Zn-dependent dehydrogenase
VLVGRGTLVQLGVSSPARFEWTPWYFKELRLIGSNAFGVEEVEGERRHAIEHYLALVADGRIDLSGMLTHRFALEDWRHAFTTLINQGETGAIKVAFDLRGFDQQPQSAAPAPDRSSRSVGLSRWVGA